MAKLVYSTIMSLDGYTADNDGNFDWAKPDPEVFTFINDLERGFGTYLYGRRMYETMVYWETFDAAEGEPPCVRDFAEIWRDAAKVVYSKTLGEVSSTRTRIERAFEPETVLQMLETSGLDISVGGPRPRKSCDGGRIDRRDAPVHDTRHGRRRHPCAFTPLQFQTRVAGYRSLRKWSRSSSLPH